MSKRTVTSGISHHTGVRVFSTSSKIYMLYYSLQNWILLNFEAFEASTIRSLELVRLWRNVIYPTVALSISWLCYCRFLNKLLQAFLRLWVHLDSDPPPQKWHPSIGLSYAVRSSVPIRTNCEIPSTGITRSYMWYTRCWHLCNHDPLFDMMLFFSDYYDATNTRIAFWSSH